jgi:hypothetical protein
MRESYRRRLSRDAGLEMPVRKFGKESNIFYASKRPRSIEIIFKLSFEIILLSMYCT